MHTHRTKLGTWLIATGLSVGGCGSGPDSTHPVDDAGGSTSLLELASDEALEILADPSALPVFSTGAYREFSSQDRRTGARPVIDLAANGNRDWNNFICKSADAWIIRNALFPLIFDLESCPDPYVRGAVLARVEGSGRLSRIHFVTSAPTGNNIGRKVLRVYVDEATTPVVEVPFLEAVAGTAGDMFTAPFVFGSPTMFVWYYPVSFKSRLVVSVDEVDADDLIFYQADVVIDEAAASQTPRTEPSPVRERARAALTLRGIDAPEAQVLLPSMEYTIAADATMDVADIEGPATINAATFEIAATDLGMLDDVDIEVSWDNAIEPAIRQSLATLLASSLDAPSSAGSVIAGEMRGSRLLLSLRLPMPFRSHARWALHNSADRSLAITVRMEGGAGVPSNAFGTLHTEYAETVAPTDGTMLSGPHPAANLSGRGRLVGLCLLMEGHSLPDTSAFPRPFNFLEGDQNFVLDGVQAVSGTGTEDYLNSSFYFDAGPFANVFSQAHGIVSDITAHPARGRVSSCRWHMATDAIDFQQSLVLNVEIGPGNPSLLDRYRSTAFYYR